MVTQRQLNSALIAKLTNLKEKTKKIKNKKQKKMLQSLHTLVRTVAGAVRPQHHWRTTRSHRKSSFCHGKDEAISWFSFAVHLNIIFPDRHWKLVCYLKILELYPLVSILCILNYTRCCARSRFWGATDRRDWCKLNWTRQADCPERTISSAMSFFFSTGLNVSLSQMTLPDLLSVDVFLLLLSLTNLSDTDPEKNRQSFGEWQIAH